MKDGRKKILAIVMIIVVLLLGVAAVFVTLNLQQAQVPTAPTSKPRASEWLGGGSCTISFAVAAAATATATVTTTATATVTATATATPACSQACPSEGVVSGSLMCQGGMWRNSSCPTTDNNACVCPSVTNAPVVSRTPAPTGVAPTAAPPQTTRTPTPTAATLPGTGTINLPGAAAFGGGLLLTILGIVFAL